MRFSDFSLRDWLLFLGAYVVWVAIMALVWRAVRKRIGTGLRRSVLFALIFAPAPCPIVREAFVIAPVSLSALSLSLVYGLQWSSAASMYDFASVVFFSCVLPFLAVLVGHRLLTAAR